MDTGLILSISKRKINLVSLIAAIILIAACSHSQKTISKQSEISKVAPIDLSPTSKLESGFIDKTEEYGLKDLKAVHLYAVKLNQDEYTDLVLLEDFYSSPKFLIFNPNRPKKKRM